MLFDLNIAKPEHRFYNDHMIKSVSGDIMNEEEELMSELLTAAECGAGLCDIQLEIIPVQYGKSVLAESMVFQHGAVDKFYPIVFLVYLIRMEGRLLLVDAGCETMPGFDMQDFIGPVKALEQMGITTDDISDVIITHAHHDHIACVNRFRKATIYIQKDEYESGKGYFAKGQNVYTFEECAEICKGVKAVRIGGHSVGSCIVEIQKGTDTYILAGDECYLRECLDRKIPTGCSYCLEKSRSFIEKYGQEPYKVLLFHDLT